MMGHPRHSNEEIATRAEKLYEQEIRAKVEAGNVGKYLAVDIETGDYVVDEDEMNVIKRAMEKHPGGAFHLLRIGYPTMGRIGANATRIGA
jgi:hypothetical protein